MTLRRRIMLGCSVIAAVLLAADAFLLGTLRSVLLEGVDAELIDSANRLGRLTTFRPFAGSPAEATLPAPAERTVVVAAPRPNTQVLTDLFIAVLDDGRSEILPVTSALGAPTSQLPVLEPAVVREQLAVSGKPEPFTVEAADGSQAWRLVAVPGLGADTLIVGMSLRAMNSTVTRVMTVAGGVTGAILAILAAVALWMIRLGVRPMTHMAATAEAIAAGDLRRRIEVCGSRTEAARLGASLNTMLERIGDALAARRSSEERLRRFIADASHELRTPLTSVMGYTELLRNGGVQDPADRAEAMRRLDEEARRMGVLVDDLLLLAHLDEGRPLQRTRVALDRIAADAVADARVVDPGRPVSLHAAPVEVSGDQDRLRQAVSNLLANVRLHTPPGTPAHVEVRGEEEYAYIEVADEGPGVDPTERSRLFERFYRGDPARSPLSGGTGLGLAIVAAVAEAHRGRVSVGERPGGGARFTIELPCSMRPTHMEL